MWSKSCLGLGLGLDAVFLLIAGVSANCVVPSSWGPFVVSNNPNCVPGASLPTGYVCAQTCVAPTNQYTSTGSGAATCASNQWTGFTLQCAPLNGNLIDAQVWCGSTSASYINGFTYYEVRKSDSPQKRAVLSDCTNAGDE